MRPGTAIYQPENLLRLPNVSFEGLLSGFTNKDVYELDGPREDVSEGKIRVVPLSGTLKRAEIALLVLEGKKEGVADVRTNETGGSSEAENQYDNENVYEGAVFRRTIMSGKWEVYTKNAGHLGPLDDPEQTDRLHGMHKFSAGTMRV